MSLLVQTTQSKEPLKNLDGSYGLIGLTKGLICIVDQEDFINLSKWRWHAHLSHGRYYAMRTVHSKNSIYQVRMHRQIMHTPNNQFTHHKNRCTLDNRKKNLQNVTDEQHKKIHNLTPSKTSCLSGPVFCGC